MVLEILDDVHKLFEFCSELEWLDEDDHEQKTLAHDVAGAILEAYVYVVRNNYGIPGTCTCASVHDFPQHHKCLEVVRPFFSRVYEWREHEDEEINNAANVVFDRLKSSLPELMGEKFGEIIDEFLENANPFNIRQPRLFIESIHEISSFLFSIFSPDHLADNLKVCPEFFEGRVNEIVAAIFENFEETTLYSAMPFLWELAKVFPKVTYRTPLFILL